MQLFMVAAGRHHQRAPMAGLSRCSAEKAFEEVLQARSQHENVRLHTTAVQLLDSLTDRGQPPL
jgi:hypothetical protein